MKTRYLRFLSLFFAILLGVTACNFLSPPQPVRSPLKIAYSPWPGYLPLVIAKEKGFFTAQGVNVETFYSEDTSLQMADFAAGKYDGVALALGTIVPLIDKNPTLRIILAIDESAGADAIVAQTGISKVQDLKGKAVGVRVGGFGELFITKMLETAKLTTEDVRLIYTQAQNIPASLQSGEIQAGHTWEPYVSQVVKSGSRVLFTSAQTPGLVPDAMAFQGSTLRDRPADIRAFLRAWFQAVDYWLANPKEGNAIIAKSLNVPLNTISLEGVKLSTLKDNIKAFTPGDTTESLYYTTQLYANFFIRTGGLNRPPDLNKILDPSFVKQQ